MYACPARRPDSVLNLDTANAGDLASRSNRERSPCARIRSFRFEGCVSGLGRDLPLVDNAEPEGTQPPERRCAAAWRPPSPHPNYSRFCVLAKATPKSKATTAPSTGTPKAGSGMGATSSRSAPRTTHSARRSARWCVSGLA